VVVSTHPRTRSRLDAPGLGPPGDVASSAVARRLHRPEREARLVLTDSGTVQEECCILGIPNVTLRDVTERPETIDCGSNILSGAEPDDVVRCVRVALGRGTGWRPPDEYLAQQVSGTVAKIVLAFSRPGL
jgi:UDP-N-acetylglucosamine 2-epimerase (non-hydrolysing)